MKKRTSGKRLADRLKMASYPPGSACEVCGVPWAPGRVPNWDHDHGTGKFRGWTCSGCNLAMGHAADSPMILEALARYLRERGYTPKR